MAILLLLILFSIVPCIFFTNLFLGWQQNSGQSWRRPPGPKGLPFIGNIHQYHIQQSHIWLTNLSKQYGPLLYLKLFRLPVVVISSADVAKKALKDNDIAFSGRPSTSASLRLSYDHSDIITSPHSDYWRKVRKMVVQHLFSPQKIRSFRPVREDEVSRMISRILETADSEEVIDVGEMVSSFNCNILCRVAFGKRLDQPTQSSIWLDSIISRVMAMVIETFVADCVVFGWINKLTGSARRVERIFEDMDSFYQQIIDEHLHPDRPDSMCNDILDVLIRLRQEEHFGDVKIDWKHIKGIVMNIFFAGMETTATSLVWAMTALMKNPNAMMRVQEEIRNLVRKKGLVDEDDIEKLPYLKAVVKETLRLYPTVPLVPKEVTEACVIDGYEIEAKTFVFVNIWAICRDPDFWENADEFLPERFLNTNLDFKGQQFDYVPFGSGRRICSGALLATANMEVALANLLYFFNWETPHGKRTEDIDTQASIGLTLRKENPLYQLAKTYT